MTPYTPEDLAEGWEFKILRSSSGRFRNPERLADVLREEAAAGWELLEKFDDRRIRLKRPRSARENDRGLALDPYRSHIGMSEAAIAGLAVGLAVAVVVVILLVTKGG